jgi:endonuclease/exonuclease/phosphatase family metal-dependent hydrolase
VRVRILTYNVQSLRRGLDRVAAVIADEDPDVALLQECGTRGGVVKLAEALGMQSISTHRAFGRVRNAVLYGQAWRLRGREVPEFVRVGRTLRRGAMVAWLRREGVSMTAVSTHLGLVPAERVEHARELTDRLAAEETPVVVGADLNESPEAPAARWIGARYFDAFAQVGEGTGPTFPAAAPTARIDYLFVGGAVSVQRVWVPEGREAVRASDHLPVVANLDIGR